jgi:hypothetical protein
VVICAKAAQTHHLVVLRSKVIKILTHLKLGQGVREVVLPAVDDILRDIGVEVVKRLHSDTLKHLSHVIFRMREI